MNLFGRIMLGILYVASFVTIIYSGINERWIDFVGGFFCFFIAVLIDFRFDTLGEFFRENNKKTKREQERKRYQYECEHLDFPKWIEKR
jgi:hypothetical protein